MSTKNKIKQEEIRIPEKFNIEIIEGIVKVSGPLGSNEKKLNDPRVIMKKEGDKLFLSSKQQTRNGKKLVKTFKAHIKNMINGVDKNYTYKLKICSGHFPMNVSMSSNKIIIKNFFAEKIPREAKILPNVDVKIDSDIITVKGNNKELVGQTAANIEQACRITNRDRRIFMDGIYIVSKVED